MQQSQGSQPPKMPPNFNIASPISILDNNAQYLTQISSENATKIGSMQKQDSVNSMNLT